MKFFLVWMNFKTVFNCIIEASTNFISFSLFKITSIVIIVFLLLLTKQQDDSKLSLKRRINQLCNSTILTFYQLELGRYFFYNQIHTYFIFIYCIDEIQMLLTFGNWFNFYNCKKYLTNTKYFVSLGYLIWKTVSHLGDTQKKGIVYYSDIKFLSKN